MGVRHFRSRAAPLYSSEAYKLFSQMAVQPDATRKGVIDTLIVALKTAGLWNKFDLFYWLAASTAQQALLNWVFPGTNTLTPVNSPTFTADRGYNGDGSTSYLDPGIFASATVRFTRDSAHMGGWKRAVVSTGRAIWGTSTAVDFLRLSSSANISARINSGTTLNNAVSVGTKHVVSVRRDASNHFSYGDGGQEGTAAIVSVAPPAGSLTILKDSSGAFEDGQIVCAHLGSQLSTAEVLALFNALSASCTAIGA